jgi:ribosomal protection tetracycline resistance protein
VLRRLVNLGILAHVDAGKTTLTERLLFSAGAIDEIGRVDDGTTQTDTLALERQRGITIKSAVVSFRIGDVTVNLIDTPGHPDFIAEVERVLGVLDGAVLVVSAVEGVQPQTRILMRALQRLRVPTLFFVNKIDRRGAGDERVLAAIADRLTPAIVAMGAVHDIGARTARFDAYPPDDPAFAARLGAALADHDDELLAAYVEEDGGVSPARLRAALAEQTARTDMHPVFFGSAATGAGVDSLMQGVAELMPSARRGGGDPVSGSVFKVERGPAGEKIALVRMFSGTLRIRDRVPVGGSGSEAKVTGLEVFADGTADRRGAVTAGEIGRLWGLPDARIGDPLGTPRAAAAEHHFAPPTLEVVVLPALPAELGALRTALAQLAEQDPLIAVRQDDIRREISLSLYGEVQKEVIEATLEADYGLKVAFRETTTICIERPAAVGAAVERLHEPPNPFLATVGLRIEPAAPGSGVTFRRDDVELGSMPLAFFRVVEEVVHESLRQGLRGWQVTDCAVTMTHSGYLGKHGHGHQYFSKSLSSTGEDFRKLTPLVVMAALLQAGTVVCEPIERFRLDAPADTLGALLPALARLGGVPEVPVADGSSYTVRGDIPAAQVNELRRRLPALTRGEGVLEVAFDRYEPVRGRPPDRPRTDDNPLDRKQYLLRVNRLRAPAGVRSERLG